MADRLTPYDTEHVQLFIDLDDVVAFARQVETDLNRALKTYGLSCSDWLILRRLLRDGPTFAFRIAAATGLHKSAISRSLILLQHLQLVRRQQDFVDLCASQVHLTEVGRRTAEELEELVAGYGSCRVAGLDQADVSAFVRVLAVLAAATVPAEGEPDPGQKGQSLT